MEYPEVTPEQIRDFLKGRMSAKESDAFRQRIADDPALEEQVAFARLLTDGLADIAQRGTQQRRNPKEIFFMIVDWILVSVILYMWAITPPPLLPSPPAPPIAGVSVAYNEHGEIIVGGEIEGEAHLGDSLLSSTGQKDFFLAGYDDSLNYSWHRQYGSREGNDYLKKITLDTNGNIIVTGSLYGPIIVGDSLLKTVGRADGGEGDFFIAKIKPRGEAMWLDRSGGVAVPNKQTGSNKGTAVAVDRQNNIIAVGMYIGSPKLGHDILPVGGPNDDMYLVKYSPDGKVQWATAVTCDYQIYAFGLATDPEGNIFVTGSFGHHNLSGAAYFEKTTLYSYGGRDIFIAKYTPLGKLEWVRQAGSPNLDGRDFGQSIAVDNSGNCVVTGFYEGTAAFGETALRSQGRRDVFLAKYDAQGKLLWAETMGGKQNDRSNTVCLDKEGNIYCAGHFTGRATIGDSIFTSLGNDDIFIVKYNKNGRFEWAKQAGGTGSEWQMDSAHEISLVSGGLFILTGMFSGQMHYGKKVMPGQAEKGIFLIFFDEKGNFKGIKVQQV